MYWKKIDLTNVTIRRKYALKERSKNNVKDMIVTDIDIFSSVTSKFQFFKQPHKIGDVIEVNEKNHLIISIEYFELYSQTLTINYTTQILDYTNYLPIRSKGNPWRDNEIEVEIQYKFDDERIKNFKLGITAPVEIKGKKYIYKLLEYTGIEFIGTDIKISGIMRPVYPINPKEARAKLRQEKMKKLKMEVF